jgi:hypothetical protein
MPPRFHFTLSRYTTRAAILLFVILYIIAAMLYPGGSEFNPHGIGFSWLHNYWCNLLNEKAINGEINTARPWAYAAMAALDVALLSFWWHFPKRAGFTPRTRFLLQGCGIVAAALSFFLPTSAHDIIVNIAPCFGLVAMAGVFVGLKRMAKRRLFIAGLLILAWVAANNIFYHTPTLFPGLALLQKLTFVYILVWVWMVESQTQSINDQQVPNVL